MSGMTAMGMDSRGTMSDMTKEERSFFSRNGHNTAVIGQKAISLNFDVVTIAIVL
jgi:hypothetical protein